MYLPPWLLRLTSDSAFLAACGALVLLVVAPAVFLLFRRKPWLSRIRRRALLTPNETEFFHRLQRALPAYRVFPQVAFAALLTDDGALSRRARWALRARFDRKIADFIVCEARSLKVVALIELDDRTHDANADRQRDAITKAAGYQTFRFESKAKPSEAELAALFQHAQAWG
ncbi:DUF2726 domain-containing protein [Paludibaculum fermentans]|uniref:DUF2726 domain-containing protein n=1 Tax=Paludibaculum fermentans TaxID=1473598 RepID=UPI003EBB4233